MTPFTRIYCRAFSWTTFGATRLNGNREHLLCRFSARKGFIQTLFYQRFQASKGAPPTQELEMDFPGVMGCFWTGRDLKITRRVVSYRLIPNPLRASRDIGIDAMGSTWRFSLLSLLPFSARSCEMGCLWPREISEDFFRSKGKPQTPKWTTGFLRRCTARQRVIAFLDLPKLSCSKQIDLLTFWFSHFGPYLAMTPKGDHRLVPGSLGREKALALTFDFPW